MTNVETTSIDYGIDSAVSNPPTKKWIPLVVGCFAGGVCSLAAAWNNWIWAHLFAGFCAAFASVAVVWFMESIAGRYLRSKWVQIGVPIFVGAACSYVSILTPGKAIERIFGIVPPAGISDGHVRRVYVGGPGDEEMLVWFHATPQAIEALVKATSLDRDDDAESKLAAGMPIKAVIASGMVRLGDKAWDTYRRGAGSGLPEVYVAHDDATVERLRLIYDRQSGIAIVMYILG